MEELGYSLINLLIFWMMIELLVLGNSVRSSRMFGEVEIQGGVVMFMGSKGFALKGVPRESLNCRRICLLEADGGVGY